MTTAQDFQSVAARLIRRALDRDDFESADEYQSFVEEEALSLSYSLAHVANDRIAELKAL